MDKARFEKAKRQVEIIDACETVIRDNKEDEVNELFPIPIEIRKSNIADLILLDTKVTRSFLRWVENEKTIAEQKFKEI